MCWRLLLLGLGIVLPVVGVAGVFMLARADVVAEVGSGSAQVRLSAVRLSGSHGVRVEFALMGHDELRHAQWRLWPVREVVVGK